MQTLPKNQAIVEPHKDDSPLTDCLKELESELLADRRIPDDPSRAARLQATRQLALHDGHLQPRLLQARPPADQHNCTIHSAPICGHI